MFLPLSEGEEIDDGSTYALRIQGQVGALACPINNSNICAGIVEVIVIEEVVVVVVVVVVVIVVVINSK